MANDDAMRTEARRAALRDMLVAIAPQSPCLTEDRFEHCFPDADAIAQMFRDQCAEKIRIHEMEWTKKWSVTHEREVKVLTQKSIKDKQALKIESEADKRVMGLEIARVKKRLIEVEREKHQASCQAAQAHRDGRHLKQQIKSGESLLEELTAVLKQKTEALSHSEKTTEKYKRESEEAKQKLKENVHNLEAKLNNQDASWEQRCDAIIKGFEDDRRQQVTSIEERVTAQCNGRMKLKLHDVQRQLARAVQNQLTCADQLNCIREQFFIDMKNQVELCRDRGREIWEVVHTTKEALNEIAQECQLLNDDERQRRHVHEKAAAVLKTHGVFSIQELSTKSQSLEQSLHDMTEQNCFQRKEMNRMQQEIAEQKQTIARHEELHRIQTEDLEQIRENLNNSAHEVIEIAESKHQLERRYGNLEKSEKQLEEETASLSRQLQDTCEMKTALEREKRCFEHDLHQATERHKEELEAVKEEREQQLVTYVQNTRRKYFGDAAEALKQSLSDVTTQSCIRSLGVAGKLRSSGIKRNRVNSAIQSIQTKIQAPFDSMVDAADLENLHAAMLKKETQHRDPESEFATGTRSAVDDRELTDFECCLFWLVLNARISREMLVERNAKRPETSSRRDKGQNRCMRFSMKRFSTNQSSTRIDDRSGERTPRSVTETSSNGKAAEDREAEEAEQIVSLLKTYLQNSHASDLRERIVPLLNDKDN